MKQDLQLAAWYSLLEGGSYPKVNFTQVEETYQEVLKLVEEEKWEVGCIKNIFLGGFSMGAYFALHTALRPDSP